MTLQVTSSGQDYEMECLITVDDKIVYAGSVTVLFGPLSPLDGMVLNFGATYGPFVPVSLRRLGEYFVCVPTELSELTSMLYRETVVLHQDEVDDLCQSLDRTRSILEPLANLAAPDLHRLWQVLSGILPEFEDTWARVLANRFWALSTADPMIQNLFWSLVHNDWSDVGIGTIVRLRPEWDRVLVLGQEIEWVALVVGPGKKCLPLSEQWGVELQMLS